MDLISVVPMFNLYNLEWPIYSFYGPLPPAKFVFDEESRRGLAVDSIVSPGVIVSGGTVRRSVLSPGVRVGPGATVEDSVLLSGVEVGEGALVKRAIIDKEVVVPPGAVIGQDPRLEARRFTVSAHGVVVIAKHQVIEPVD
jgi:glucose-1-phosphate adenylyltransferase